jgi:hypothetical protein
MQGTWLILAQSHAPAGRSVQLSDILSNRYAIAFFAALAAFFFSMILERAKSKKVPHKALSWSLIVNKKLVEVSQGMAGQVRVYYGDHSVDELIDVRYKLVNTGNTVIKNQFIRFAYLKIRKFSKRGRTQSLNLNSA